MKQLRHLSLACILILGPLAAPPSMAATIILINGHIITGKILQTNGDNLVVMTDFGTLSYARMIIKEIKTTRADAVDSPSKERLPTDQNAIRFVGKGTWASNPGLKLALPASVYSNTISFTTKAGMAVTNAQVVRVNDGVSLIWRDGSTMGTVMLADLPEDLRVRYGYDPAKAEAAASQAKKNDAAWQQQQALAEQRAKANPPPAPAMGREGHSGHVMY